jgi:hypothetical protein
MRAARPTPIGVSKDLEARAADNGMPDPKTIDAYADGLRAWGREAQACVDEIDGDDGPEQGSAGGADTEPAPPNDAPPIAHAHASLLAAELDPDVPVRCALTPIGHFAYAEPLPRGPEPIALAYRVPSGCGHAGRPEDVCSDCGW